MKTPFYASPDRQNRFLAEARSWEGTPFRENCSVKGVDGGVDCVRYVAAVHEACGACAGVKMEVLPVEWVRSWHEHRAESRILDFFHQPGVRGLLVRVEDDEPRMIGDILVAKVGMCEHHLALWMKEKVAHCVRHAGVVFTSSRHPDFRDLVKATYRIHEIYT